MKETSESIMRDSKQDLNYDQDKKSTSSIDTNELTDMDRKEDMPSLPTAPALLAAPNQVAVYTGDNRSSVPSQQAGVLSSTKEQDSFSNKLFPAESKEPQTMSQDSFNNGQTANERIRELTAENQQHKKTIEDLKAMLRAKDQEIHEIRTFYQKQEQKRKRIAAPAKHNKLQLVQKSRMNKDLDGALPELPEKALSNNYSQNSLKKQVKKVSNAGRNDWSIGRINTRNQRLQRIGRPLAPNGSDSGDLSQNTSELPPIQNRNSQNTVALLEDSVDSSGKRVKKLDIYGNKSPILDKNKKFKALENNFSKNRDKYALAKLEALKFKMQLQNKNLRLLTQQDDLMQNIYKEERSNTKAKPLRRENKAFQNQQIVRIEKDLERTSKQLQAEIASIQETDRAILPEKLLSDIDVLFDEAENYFAKK